MLEFVSGFTLVLTALITINSIRVPLSKNLGNYFFKSSDYYEDVNKIKSIEANIQAVRLCHHRYVILSMIEKREALDDVMNEHDLYVKLGGNGYVTQMVNRYIEELSKGG